MRLTNRSPPMTTWSSSSDVQELARLDQLAGEGRVLGAGRGIAGGVVVADDDAGDGLDDRRAEDLGSSDDGR